MKSKILSIFLLTAILSLAMVSATTFTFDKANDFETITSALTGTLTTDLTINYPEANAMPISVDVITGNDVTVDTSAIDYNLLNLGTTYSGTLTISNGVDTDETHIIAIRPTFCEDGCTGNNILDLDVDIKNK